MPRPDEASRAGVGAKGRLDAHHTRTQTHTHVGCHGNRARVTRAQEDSTAAATKAPEQPRQRRCGVRGAPRRELEMSRAAGAAQANSTNDVL